MSNYPRESTADVGSNDSSGSSWTQLGHISRVNDGRDFPYEGLMPSITSNSISPAVTPKALAPPSLAEIGGYDRGASSSLPWPQQINTAQNVQHAGTSVQNFYNVSTSSNGTADLTNQRPNHARKQGSSSFKRKIEQKSSTSPTFQQQHDLHNPRHSQPPNKNNKNMSPRRKLQENNISIVTVDGYRKVVVDLMQIWNILTKLHFPSPNGSFDHQNAKDHELAKRRIDEIDEAVKRLRKCQLMGGFLNNDCNLPKLVLDELRSARSKLDWATSTLAGLSNQGVVHINGDEDSWLRSITNQMKQADEMIASTKSNSDELVSQLEKDVRKSAIARAVAGSKNASTSVQNGATHARQTYTTSSQSQHPSAEIDGHNGCGQASSSLDRDGVMASALPNSNEEVISISDGSASAIPVTHSGTKPKVSRRKGASLDKSKAGKKTYGNKVPRMVNHVKIDPLHLGNNVEPTAFSSPPGTLLPTQSLTSFSSAGQQQFEITEGGTILPTTGTPVDVSPILSKAKRSMQFPKSSGKKQSSANSLATQATLMMGVVPTMAPPMGNVRPAFPPPPDTFYDVLSSVSSSQAPTMIQSNTVGKATGKKTGKKRRRGVIDANDNDHPKGKKKRARAKSRPDKAEEPEKELVHDENTTNEPLKGAEPLESEQTSASVVTEMKEDLPKKVKTAVIVTDDYPQRIVNPLLTLPRFPKSLDTPLEEIPQGGELWAMADLHFSHPDTFSISFLARLLGFDVPETGIDQPFAHSFDPDTIPKCKSDAWLQVPPCGLFVDQVWNRRDNLIGTEDDDALMNYRDPMWVNILSTYRGYNEEDFKEAGRGFQKYLSPDCLKFARDRGILSENLDLSFRFGTLGDEALLQSILDKSGRSSKHDLATCLKSQSIFYIIAETKEGNPLGFIQYRFCWCKVEEKKASHVQLISYGVRSRAGEGSSTKVSELVIFIDDLVCDRSDAKESDLATCNVEKAGKPFVFMRDSVSMILLTSLALGHASSAGIWYGMMEAPSSLLPFFSRYFRMTRVNLSQEASDPCQRPLNPLVCDLKKCSYRYAILRYEEDCCQSEGDTQTGPTTAHRGILSERMIVHVHGSSTEIMASQLESYSKLALSGARARHNLSTDDNDESKSSVTPRSECFPLMHTSNRSLSKKVRVCLVPKPTDDSEWAPSECSVELVSDCSMEDAKIPVDPSNFELSSGWDVFRVFPLRDDKDVTPKVQPDGFFVDELTKKQNELLKLESATELTARKLLKAAYEERSAFEGGERANTRELHKKIVRDYEAVLERRREADLAWQAQLEQDMDAVCDICFDGEVTPDNQIIFCDSCNVAVHQRCYGIDRVPSGNFFCRPCTHFEIDKEFLAAECREIARSAPTRLPIVCELCPRRQGAFVKVQTEFPTRKSKWVHVVCAKWHGMDYVDKQVKDEIEDLSMLKSYFKSLEISCCLCQSSVGAMNRCRKEGCDKYAHVTCARSVGTCSVQHGENFDGTFDTELSENLPWTLACPEHSEISPESVAQGCVSVDQLVAIAKSYPPEAPPQKPFDKRNGKERKEYWSDKDNEGDFFDKVMTSLHGARCAVCDSVVEAMRDERCGKCGIVYHTACLNSSGDASQGENRICSACQYSENESDSFLYEPPQCHMCNQTGGALLKSSAKPTSMKKWKKSSNEWRRSLFGKNIWCHALCGMWNPLCKTISQNDETTVVCSEIIMADGKRHLTHQYKCFLCGMANGAKVNCSAPECTMPGATKMNGKLHVTCARQAGFEVADDFTVKCFKHVGCSFVFRARLEDFIELEHFRSGDNTLKAINAPMSWDHASALFHWSVSILRTLGWAWRWAEWWVEAGDNWEPLIEDGQNESNMTKEELRIVESTPLSRCEDARRCRLSAFGAALRNRDFDKEDGDDREPLERALKAVLSVPSLVGPLNKTEIDFFVTWFALAYRSKSPLLGFGSDKIPVATDGFCVHRKDGSPKSELGMRPLPGKNPPRKGPFEPTVEEVDDFLMYPLSPSPARKRESDEVKSDKRNEAEAELACDSENEAADLFGSWPNHDQGQYQEKKSSLKRISQLRSRRKNLSEDSGAVNDDKFYRGGSPSL